ncbi:hypothetical protein UUC_18120, partial [Rhodanobacter denitrificans]
PHVLINLCYKFFQFPYFCFFKPSLRFCKRYFIFFRIPYVEIINYTMNFFFSLLECFFKFLVVIVDFLLS